MTTESVNFKEILDFALKNDILNLDDVQEQMTKKRRKELLEQHTSKSGKVQILVIELMLMTVRNQLEEE